MSDPTDRWSSNYDENESCGASSTFVRISENWGFKYARYSCRKMAANTFKSQRKAWRVGAGPFCFGLIQVKIQGRIYIGYITEVISPITIGNNGAYCIETIPEYVKPLNKLIKKLKSAGYHFYDTHSGNIARPFRKKHFVCIDFD
jgi:hypothetical protein